MGDGDLSGPMMMSAADQSGQFGNALRIGGELDVGVAERDTPSEPKVSYSIQRPYRSSFTDGQRFRVLAAVNDYTRERLALVDTSLSGLRVVRELDAVIRRRGRRRTIVPDDGTEFISRDLDLWGLYERRHSRLLPARQAHG